MEKSKRDLEALVTSQKEQLSRYEKRLKDVVTAYKGLLKEKEALETTLSALSLNGDKNGAEGIGIAGGAGTGTVSEKEVSSRRTSMSSLHSEAASTSNLSLADEDKGNMQSQIITLMNSLVTLSAEKSRMEASFQADKKQLRGQLKLKDDNIKELNLKIKENEEKSKVHLEEIKAKWIVERQEREKETNNQMLMIRELQKLYADERHLKENIEMQLNNFKTQFVSSEAENTRIRELQAQLKEARNQLKQIQSNKNILNGETNAKHSSDLLKQLQQEMLQLKEQHAVAIQNEQKRVLQAEERSRKEAALHEDRVANLEARLAELSNTVGSYDRLRIQDQESIQVLKRKLQDLEMTTENSHNTASELSFHRQSKLDVPSIIEEISRLKKILVNENYRLSNPIDLSKVFEINSDHMQCQEDLNSLQAQLDAVKMERSQLIDKMDIQKAHILNLQDKIKVLNRNIEEQEQELKHFDEKLHFSLQDERSKWKNRLSDVENEYRCKVNDLEQQLQKQRQRSLQLLDEKEQEIKTLQTSFEVFHASALATSVEETLRNDQNVISSDAESNEGNIGLNSSTSASNKIKIKSKKLSMSDNCHMLHYVNELARKDIEITALRKAKYSAETSLRRAIHEKVTAQEELSNRIASLEEDVDRLERCKTREGANLEYLKNVIISFITTKDPDGRRHMLNAISAVLQFTDNEIHLINNAFQKK